MKKTRERKTYMYIECGPVQVRPVKQDGYGSVPDLDDEELADPRELERVYLRQEFGPILALPVRKTEGGPRPEYDEDGFAVGPFGMVDFDRIQPAFDKARYKADKLREERKDVLIRFDIIRERLPHENVRLVFKRLREGSIEVDDIADFDMWWMAKFYLRAERLRRQIAELDEASWQRKQRAHQKWLDSLG
jgi:hypothetical protein